MATESNHTPGQSTNPTRRAFARGLVWSAPVSVVALAAPAFAASGRRFDVVFDGGGGANGALNSMYLNLRIGDGRGPYTLTNPLTLTTSVVGLTGTGTAERSFTAGSSNGAITRSAYDPVTRTTVITWTIPAGTTIPETYDAAANPDILFSFGDGLATGGRITNKVVVTNITNGEMDKALPIDSSVVRDYDQKAVSADGIY